MYKKRLWFLLAPMVFVLAACSTAQTDEGGQQDKLEVNTTVFALESITGQIAGDNAEVKSIYPNGADIHTFEPTQKDMMEYAEGDLFITTNKELDAVSGKISDVVKDETEVLEAAGHTENLREDAHSHDHGHGHDHSHGELDPHVWIDPVHTIGMAESIKEKLSEIDPDNAAAYEENFKKVESDLTELDEELKAVTADSKVDTVYISHESIGYLADRYGFHQHGVSGMNNEEPTQQEVIEMIEGLTSDGSKYILVEQNVSSRVTDIIKDAGGLELLEFHNLSVLTDEDDPDTDYQTLMRNNIEVLGKAMNDYSSEEAKKNENGQPEAHDHSADEDVYNGYFDDGDVKDRSLSDWEGEWQSVYPYLEDGTLGPVFEHKAEDGEMTQAEYKEYYTTGYRTDVEKIDISNGKMTFHQNGETVTGEYVYDGYEILEYEAGNRGVRYLFSLKDSGNESSGLPRHVQFSDHGISPTESSHFHIYMGNDTEKLLREMDHWPTYYPDEMSGDEIKEEMLHH
ncbi:metal ABC transporter solute-binding protein, Zn/Mn family [Salinicoccus sp. HZC-1]|uniref:metal ABC transporter solute-binding protein, Zn/Mn family n=1 Tax=Salinicoccus sp. HZC-1 TaxID=3385497 RepID=UPI00398A75CA